MIKRHSGIKAIAALLAGVAATGTGAPVMAQAGMFGPNPWEGCTAHMAPDECVQMDEMQKLLEAAERRTLRDPTDPTKQGTNMGKPGFNVIVAEGLEKAQKALAAKDYLEAMAQAKLAQAGVENDYENLRVYQFLILCNVQMGHHDAAVDDAVKASELSTISNDERRELYTDAIVLSFNDKKYDKALFYAQRMQALDLKDPLSQQAIGQALYYGGDNNGALEVLQKQAAAKLLAGETPSESLLGILVSAQAKGHDQPNVEKTLQLLGTNYDGPFYWQSMVDFAFFEPGLSDLDKIYLGRLMFATNAKISQQNADRVGQAAANLNFYADAANWSRIGATGFTLDGAKVAADQASLSQQIASGETLDGAANARLAESLYDNGMFAEAEAAARRALAKDASDKSEPQIMLGMALYAQGKYASAEMAFESVKSGSPATPDVARLWAILAKHKASPSVMAAAKSNASTP